MNVLPTRTAAKPTCISACWRGPRPSSAPSRCKSPSRCARRPGRASVSDLRHSVGQALLFKKHPLLYRQKIQGGAPWDYYAIVAVLLLAIAGTVAGIPALAAAGVLVWLVLTTRLCQVRLQGTSRSLWHVAEIVITSVLIPPLAVFWRLTGALRYRVRFA